MLGKEINTALCFQRNVSFFLVNTVITLMRPTKWWVGEEVMGLSWIHKSEWFKIITLMINLSLQKLLQCLSEANISIAQHVGGGLELGNQTHQGLNSDSFINCWVTWGKLLNFLSPKVSSPAVGDNNSTGFLSCDHQFSNLSVHEKPVEDSLNHTSGAPLLEFSDSTSRAFTTDAFAAGSGNSL